MTQSKIIDIYPHTSGKIIKEILYVYYASFVVKFRMVLLLGPKFKENQIIRILHGMLKY